MTSREMVILDPEEMVGVEAEEMVGVEPEHTKTVVRGLSWA